jgi:hypothetical protein
MRTQLGSILFTFAAATSFAAHADVMGPLDNASISVGGFANNISADIRADGSVPGSGTRLDLDRDLNQGGTHGLAYIDATWRPWERHEFEISYYSVDQTRTRTLSRNIEFNDKTFVVGGQLSNKFSVDAGSIVYRYWLWTDESAAFGISGGLQWYSLGLDLSGEVGAVGPDGSVTTSGTASAKISSTLPDPSLGLAYRYQMSDWARLVADGGGFKINIENVDATLYNFRLGVEFYPWTNFGIITQYAYNKIEADISRSKFLGSFNAEFSGLQVLLKARF